jgi:hypothetical protein
VEQVRLTAPDARSKALPIFVILGVNPSVLLERLHLEALGDCVLLLDSLVTLGGCYHLDSLEQ